MDEPYLPVEPAPETPISEEPYTPIAFRNSGRVFWEEGAILPTESCIRCGRPSKKVIRKSLRNAKNPLTWYGKSKKVEIGLCKKDLENWNVAVASTYSTLVLGLILLGVGISSLSYSMIIVGSLVILFSGFFRARIPIQTPSSKTNPIEIRGVGEPYLQVLPEVAWEDSESPEE